MRPNFTLNYGVRWELALPFLPLNSSYATVTPDALWGVSGPGNLFKPGTLTGSPTQFIDFKAGTPAYNTDHHDFAPSVGFAWSPDVKSGWLKRIVGDSGQTVVRGGYSIAYSRRGIGELRAIFAANPGITITTNRDLTTGNLVGGSLGSLPLLLSQTSRLGAPAFNAAPTYPFAPPAITNSANIIDPNIKTPYVQSWTFGIQREISKDMALEVRYIGNRFLQNWVVYNLNETNIVENGFLNEFKLAQANLQANIAAGRGNTFKYAGPSTGTSPLPIYLAYFSGLPASQASDTTKYTSTNFSSTNFTNPLALQNPNPLTPASNSSASGLFGNATLISNALAAGLPANFFLTNPGLQGGANFTGNGGYTTYNALQIDLRRRLSKGLLVQANYQFAKAFSSTRVSFRAPRVNSLDNGSNSTLRHAIKAQLDLRAADWQRPHAAGQFR